MNCATCRHSNRDDAQYCAICGGPLTTTAQNDAPAPKRHSPSAGTYIALGTGLVLFFVARVIIPYGVPQDAPPILEIADPLIHLAIWSVFLGAIALIIAAVSGSVRRRWVPVFAWLFFAAAIFEVVVGSFTHYVQRTRIEAKTQSIFDRPD